jgi:hypothetical protein
VISELEKTWVDPLLSLSGPSGVVERRKEAAGTAVIAVYASNGTRSPGGRWLCGRFDFWVRGALVGEVFGDVFGGWAPRTGE